MLILLILVPLIWILRFKDCVFGFVCSVSAIIAGNAGIAIFLQSFGLFKFSFLFAIHFLVAAFTIIYNRKLIFEFIKNLRFIQFSKISWAFLIALSIIGFQLYSVHFNYSGLLTTFEGVKIVKEFKAGHPYFSDEWIAIGMSEKSIETGGLPFINIFNEASFLNFLFVFHSLISGIDLLLDLNLISSYQTISIIFSLILITFAYILLRSFKISVGISILLIFLISYLPNSSNLPLLWYLLPWNVGLVFLLSYFISIKKEYFKTAIALNLLSIIFYPPLVVLAAPSFLLATLKIQDKKHRLKNLITYVSIIIFGLITAIVFVSFGSSEGVLKTLKTLGDFSIRTLNSALGEPPLFIVWRVVPWFLVPFSIWSLWKMRHSQSFLTFPIFIGLVLWFLYSIKFNTFFIDYHRTVAITSILLVLISAFSLENFKNFVLTKIKFLNKKNTRAGVVFLLLILFFVLSFSFTEREKWRMFKTGDLLPSPPANNYLYPDDLRLFKDIHNQTFLAPPWKGLVLSIATDNKPVTTKPSTLGINLIDYQKFIFSECNVKKDLIKRFKVSYVYTPEIKCEGFELLGKSSEELHLYLVK